MSDFKFYLIGWVIMHLFLAGFMSIVYFLAGVQFDIVSIIKCALIISAIEALVIGAMVGLYKLGTYDE